MSAAHLNAIVTAVRKHGLPATYTRLDTPVVSGLIQIANISFQERPADSDVPMVQMSMRWLVLASDLTSIGISRPFDGDRIEIPAIDVILTVNRYGPRIADGTVIAYDIEATGR